MSEQLPTLTANARQVWSETDPYTLERYGEFCRFLTDGQSVLDIGCNTGRGGEFLRQRFPNAFLCGMDLVADRIAKIPAGTYDELVCSDIVAWSTTKRFDRILAGEVIEHIPADAFDTMLLKCRSLLADGGLIIFTTPNPRSLLVLLGRRAVFRDPSHVNIMTPANLRTSATRAGLALVAVHGSGKATRLFGRLPFLPLYGSYLAVLRVGVLPEIRREVTSKWHSH
jgi:2-polyprenyl-3-methyl-5-hydroxy-6-metoxy-1,4-benzoquinol methylase